MFVSFFKLNYRRANKAIEAIKLDLDAQRNKMSKLVLGNSFNSMEY